MNKKKLSVVMAGAMLASSVAPVLAADLEKSEYSAAQLGLLKKELRELLESKKFHSTDKNLANQSVYYVTKGLTGTKYNTEAGLDTLVSSLKTGDKVYVWSHGFRTDEKGNFFSTEDTEGTSVGTYSKEDLTKANIESDILEAAKTAGKFMTNEVLPVTWDTNNSKYKMEKSDSVVVVEEGKSVVVRLKTGLEVELKLGDKKVDFTKAVDKDGYTVSGNVGDKEKAKSIVGFAEAKTDEGKDVDIAEEKLKEITIVTGGNDLAVSDLYDGLMLTEEGHDFLNQIKYYDKVAGNQHKVTITPVERIAGTDKYTFSVKFNKVDALSEQTYTVTGENKAEAEKLNEWLSSRLARVDILAGANRYETAVAIAKEQALTGKDLGDETHASNIVLVNGNSLVDGLSAAPLAAKLKIHATAGYTAAPILLTEADALPKATKVYLKELLAKKPVGSLNTTIHLVGGTSVLNKSLERELRSLGFDVVRYGGANREETSLKVAEKIGGDNAFVVGAEGEADAMSIAAVAATNKTPIIVSKKGGLTEDALLELKGADVTVIGGENAVSKADYEAVKAEANSLNRVAGANRKATNALVIEKYYGKTFGNATGADFTATTAQNVIVAKDGQNNKMELVDALAAANMASNKKAPVVLATDKLSDAQINALELNAQNAKTLYQVGNGVAKDVVKTIAQRLGLAN